MAFKRHWFWSIFYCFGLAKLGDAPKMAAISEAPSSQWGVWGSNRSLWPFPPSLLLWSTFWSIFCVIHPHPPLPLGSSREGHCHFKHELFNEDSQSGLHPNLCSCSWRSESSKISSRRSSVLLSDLSLILWHNEKGQKSFVLFFYWRKADRD